MLHDFLKLQLHKTPNPDVLGPPPSGGGQGFNHSRSFGSASSWEGDRAAVAAQGSAQGLGQGLGQGFGRGSGGWGRPSSPLRQSSSSGAEPLPPSPGECGVQV